MTDNHRQPEQRPIIFASLIKSMNLIIQATHSIAAAHLDHLAHLAQSKQREQIAEHVYRLPEAQAHPEIAPYCFEHQLDYGFVPRGRSLKDFGLLVMDMDSTLIAIECIDEIADMQGLKPQVAAITEAAMRGELDFAESLRRRVALLEGLDERALQRVYDERLRLNPGAEIMLAKLKEHGIRTLLVSGGFVFFTERIKARLQLDFAHANTLEIIDGKLTGRVLGKIFDAQGKADWLAGGHQHRLPRQAGGARTGQLRAELCRAGWAGESAGLILKTAVAMEVGANLFARTTDCVRMNSHPQEQPNTFK